MVERGGGNERVTAAIAAVAPRLLSYLERRVGLDDAPDLLAETMVTAWRRCDDLPMDADEAQMWLFGIARATLLNAERGARRRWRLASRLRAMTTANSRTHPAADAGIEVRDALDRLDADLAELVRLVHWDGFSIAEASAIVGIPASTARGKYQRAKEQLRQSLGSSIPTA